MPRSRAAGSSGWVELPSSSLAPGIRPVSIFYRRFGRGVPLLFLHGGWGYLSYPVDSLAVSLAEFDVFIPDRSGYGRSSRVVTFAQPLHQAGAEETIGFMDALSIDACVLWGHSDGAVMAANVALRAPRRVLAVVMEASHFDRHKPGSEEFFRGLTTHPTGVGPKMSSRLIEDHGEGYWEEVLAMEGHAWLRILAGADLPDQDLYGGRLSELSVPTLLLHGSNDPRTEPGELEALCSLLPEAQVTVLEGGGHCPHSHPKSTASCADVLHQFFNSALARR